MKHIPSAKECLDLLQKCGCSEAVITHSQVVRDVAMRIAACTNANTALVEAGALLHDIGRAKTNGIYHAVEGAKIATSLELPKQIIKIIERHIGAGISKKEAYKLSLPLKDYTPRTLEEKIVCHADNLVDSMSRQPIDHEVKRALLEGKKTYALRLVHLHRELSDLCGKDVNWI